MANGSTPNPENQAENSNQLTQEIHWVHRATFWSQVGLGIIGLCALFIYGCQLHVMQGQLTEMKRSGEQSTEQMWSAIGNINWEARSMDWNQKSTKEAMSKQTIAQEQAARASVIAANTAEKQRRLMQQQFDLQKSQASARLEITNFKWVWSSDGAVLTFSFDLFNAGESEAMEINAIYSGEDTSRQPSERVPEKDFNVVGPVAPNPSGPSLAKLDHKPYHFDVTKDDYRQGGGYLWYGIARFTYFTIFGESKNVCQIVHRSKFGFYLAPCPIPATKQKK
ncbi:MAG: hypothetical protein ACLPZY_00200 [Terracidiphilus sp.]